ncbi:MAG TPA: caspase family protein [Cyclobacteriaceae bacterium]|nr:caspase family protein [Cyclobacteriaceae bacterium]
MKTAKIFLAAWLLATSVFAQVSLLKKLTFPGEENIRTFSFAPNSKRIIAGGDKGTLRVFELATGESWKLPGFTSKVYAVEVSYDGRYMAASSESGDFLLYDLQESKQIELNGNPGIVRAIAFSPSNALLATGNESGKVQLWSLTTREKTGDYAGNDIKIYALAFSPTGNYLASGYSDNSTVIWNTVSGQLSQRCTGHTDWVHSVAFSADGKKMISGSYDKTIRLWDTETGKEVSQWKGHKGWVTDLQLSPDGQYLASGGGDGQAIVWKDGKIVQQLKEPSVIVSEIQFSKDGKLLAVADLSKALLIYNVSSLGIQPWKPYDVTPPSLVVLSPKLLAARDADTGFRKSVVYQSDLRILVEVNDISGVESVSIGGTKVEPQAENRDRYEVSLTLPQNSEKVVAIQAVDKLGNKLDDKLIIERKVFSGSVNDEKYFAILIAVEDYKNNDIPDLDQPAKDLDRLKEVLETKYSFKPEHISVLKNPDRQAIYDKLDEFQAKLDKIDNLLIFYAGHGYWDEQLEQGYWYPSDAVPNKRSTWFPNSTLRDYISGMSARHTLLITDACFSGGIFKSRSVFENSSTAIETLYLRKSRKAMTSGTLEAVPDKSVFIDFLVKRLTDNSEPYLPAEDLFNALRKNVINNSPNNQVPQYGVIGQAGDEGGEFIFVKKK